MSGDNATREEVKEAIKTHLQRADEYGIRDEYAVHLQNVEQPLPVEVFYVLYESLKDLRRIKDNVDDTRKQETRRGMIEELEKRLGLNS